MRSPQSRRNGETPSPRPRIQVSPPHFHSTVSEQKLRRFNMLILIFRLGSFCFTVAAAIFMVVNPRGSNSPRWYDYGSFRYVLAANGIVAVYSLVEMAAAVWEISTGVTIFPEIFQVWFDFSHDQVFAYLLLSASSTGAGFARTLRTTGTCTGSNAFCVQTAISVALGFIGFAFVGLSSLLSGFRVACFIVKGSRFHI
ncbi:CASP-like protein 4C1 [Impatiens glandulifera]|uniref:CASP-like protein 4C1 n=1 Tax=Impatiens glandulifera TaxID=253017 RepID=UPI001FB0FDFA|nr:CASP-like protein 4C1 [Impatiens glandulifera]